jgi:hypothetical protein
MACYIDESAKLALFPGVTIPGIFRQARLGIDDAVLLDWLYARGIERVGLGVGQLRALHDAARGGRYVSPAQWNCDPEQPVAQTILEGGDCDQWGAVLLAALATMGYQSELVTFGTGADPFEHVAVAGLWAGAWYLLDAKGDQAGLAFDTADPTKPVVQAWGW